MFEGLVSATHGTTEHKHHYPVHF